MPIKVLSKQLSNQIAAGEVIEGPVSVVKECVENAIDAKANDIAITLKQGGHSFIQITDNGVGMNKDDLQKCILPHATSKISEYQDLHAIHTLGFRGEALASIASVAELHITSCMQDMSNAFQGSAKPTPTGEDIAWTIAPASHHVGTTVRVEDLFYLTPARKKFMKSERADQKRIIDWVEKLSLAQWDVGFRLVADDKKKLTLPIADSFTDIENRVATILGQTFLKHSMYIDHQASGIRLHGWISMPQYDRGQPDQQFTYVNQRFVKDKIMIKAIKQAYQKLLFHGRHPAYVLYLECDPAVVDVNVHPSKAEVRFSDSRSIFQFIQTSINKSLKEVPVVVTDNRVQSQQAKEVLQPPVQAAMPLHDFSRTESYSSSVSVEEVAVLERPVVGYDNDIQSNTMSATLEQPNISYQTAVKSVPLPIQAETLQPDAATPKDPFTMHLGTAIAQCHSRYILAQNEYGLIVVDQHAAHERILFEKLKSKMDQADQIQSLLLPININLEQTDKALINEFITMLKPFGFQCACHENGLSVQAIPMLLKQHNIEKLIEDAWQTWLYENTQENKVDYIIDRILANMACKSAIKVNHSLTITQMNAILRDMEQVPYGGLCNHGRPAVQFFDLKTMDNWFLRGQ